MKSKRLKMFLSFGLICTAACLVAPAADKPADRKAGKPIPYPLKTCIVQDDKLDDTPFVFVYQNREIKLCCDGCKADFDKEPAKYLKKLEVADKGGKK
jgi:hypothetical protein